MSRISNTCSVLGRIGFVVAAVAGVTTVVTSGSVDRIAWLVFVIAGPLAFVAVLVHGLTLPREDEPDSQAEGDQTS